MTEAPLAVLVLAYGAPSHLEEVGDFLARVMGPGRVTPAVVERACCRYRALGGGSPLVANTFAQAAALGGALRGTTADARVFVGMRHSAPFLGDALAEALDHGKGQAIAVVMASHQSAKATGGYQEQVTAELARRAAGGDPGGRVAFCEDWHTHPGYLGAVAARTAEALDELSSAASERLGDPFVLFSAHSLPLGEGEDGEPHYELELRETAGGVMARVGALAWGLAYQSRSPRPGLRWLGPDVGEVLAAEARTGRRRVVVVPLGFVAEHLETLYDLDIELALKARELGLHFARARTVEDHPLFIEALAQKVLREHRTLIGEPAG